MLVEISEQKSEKKHLERFMANILIAEDDFLTRQLLQHSLELHEHRVKAVANGDDALALALEEHPEIILLDLMMPGMNGAQLIQELRKALGYDKVKIVLVTGTVNPETIPGVSEADLILSKPIPIEDLLAAVRKLLE